MFIYNFPYPVWSVSFTYVLCMMYFSCIFWQMNVIDFDKGIYLALDVKSVKTLTARAPTCGYRACIPLLNDSA